MSSDWEWDLDLGPGTWDLVPGTWYLGPGTWDLGPGTWDLGPGSAFILSTQKFDQKVKNQIGTGLGHEQEHIYKRQWPRPFTHQKRACFLAQPIYPLIWSQYLMSFFNVHWLALKQNISYFNKTKNEYCKKIKDKDYLVNT